MNPNFNNPDYMQARDSQQRYSLWNAAYILMIICCALMGAGFVITVIVFIVSLAIVAGGTIAMTGVAFPIVLLIPLAWLIPMTIRTKKARNDVTLNPNVSHMALAICCLIFAWIIPGILAVIAAVKTPMPQFNQRQF